MKLSKENKQQLRLSVVMILLGIVAIATASYAWFSLSLSTKVNTMDLQVTAGSHLKIDTVSHNSVEDYKIEVEQKNIETQLGYSLNQIQEEPITSGNGREFYRQNGKSVSKVGKKFLQFDLYFMSNNPMDVFLTEKDSADKGDGTAITSDGGNSSAQAEATRCVRISFEVDGKGTYIYEPDKQGGTTLTVPKAIKDNGGGSTQKTFSDANSTNEAANLFSLTAKNDLKQKVTVRIWIEGEDAQCSEKILRAKFKTRLRFEGVETSE